MNDRFYCFLASYAYTLFAVAAVIRRGSQVEEVFELARREAFLGESKCLVVLVVLGVVHSIVYGLPDRGGDSSDVCEGAISDDEVVVAVVGGVLAVRLRALGGGGGGCVVRALSRGNFLYQLDELGMVRKHVVVLACL